DTSLAASPAGVLANDSEPDGQTLTAALVTAPRYAASFEFRADGSFKYTPHRGFSGPDSFAYEARDPLGLATTATVSLFVVPGTAAPVARDDFATTTPGVPVAIDVTANDSDRGGFVDPATIAFLSEPTLGQASVDPDTGVVTYVPHPAFMGTDRFSYQITGPTGLTDSAVITIEILPVNKPPTAENDAATTDEGAPVAIDVTANDRDADGNLDPSSVRIVLAPANGTARVAPATGMVQYVPGVKFFGEDMFTYEVCDTHGASARARVTLTVVSRPDAPLAGDDAAQTRINQAVTVPVLANDSDADEDLVPGTLRVWNGPLHGRATVDGSTGTITYEPLANFVGSDQFTYEVCDATAFCDTATVTIHVTNAPPVAVDDAANTPEAVPVNIDLTGNDGDPDGNLDPRSVRILISPLGATVTLDPQTGVATYIPRSGFSGVDLFAYEISDTTGAYGPPAIGSVHIMVTPVNDPPQAQDDTMFALPDTPIDLDVLGNDNDVDSLIDRATVTIEEGPSSGSVVAQVDGSVRYTPRTGFTGTDQFRYTVQDDAGARSNVAVVTITVQAAPPMLVVGRVFEDTDQDGPGLEGTGIAGQLIYLLNGQAQLLATTLTQADDPATPEDETGWYHFPDLAPGTYVVAEQRMAGWRQSHPQDTGIRLPDLAVHPGLYVITLSPSHALDVLDFGTFPSSAAGYASISGRVYLDVDNDGVCDPPELGVPNVPITIDGPVTRVVVTDADGCYRAGDLPAGRYTITETQPLVFLDGRETAGAPQPGSVANDCFLDVELLPDMQGEEYNFGEYGLKAQFIGKHLYLASTPPTNVFLAQLQVTSGESLLAFTAPKDGTLCATAMLEGESQPVQLYNEHWRPVSLSAPAGTLRAPVTGGDSYLMYVGSRGTTVVNVALSPVVAAEPVFVFTNNVRAEDVNADGCVSPRDALLVINALNATGSRYLAGVNLSANYIDVSDDDYLSPIDALMVINRLNRVPDRGEGEGGAEGEGWPVELPARWLVIDSVGALMRDVAERAPSPGRASAASPVVESVWLPRGEEPWPAHRRLRDRALWEYLIETATQRAPALDDMIDMLLHPCKSRTS
ncbi:MAG: Ig-like domain-containing protein, partial [Pirellulaceae bacterium]|nr:Ig-like domain-containing protein [Pirellulaceae bacterium]